MGALASGPDMKLVVAPGRQGQKEGALKMWVMVRVKVRVKVGVRVKRWAS